MSTTLSKICNGGVDALLKAAKFVEDQEKQRNEVNTVPRPNDEAQDVREVVVLEYENSLQNSSSSFAMPLPRHGSIIREVHNKLEKNRRAHLKECFETLKKQLPLAPQEKKTSNLSILHNAIRYINILKRKEKECEHEMERLAREKIAHQQMLASLKKELSGHWEHIDFNTPCPEPRKTSESEISRVIDTVSQEECVQAGTLYSSTSPLQSDSVTHLSQVVNTSGSPSFIVSPLAQILPDTHFIHTQLPAAGNSTLVTSGTLNHPVVVPQPSGPFILATPTHITEKVITSPAVLPPQFLVKPTMVVVSAAANN